MVLDVFIYFALAGICILLARLAIGNRQIEIGIFSKIVNSISLSCLFIFLLMLFGLSGRISSSAGPRGKLETYDAIVIGPRFSLNPT
jgi:hypothetical protein